MAQLAALSHARRRADRRGAARPGWGLVGLVAGILLIATPSAGEIFQWCVLVNQ